MAHEDAEYFPPIGGNYGHLLYPNTRSCVPSYGVTRDRDVRQVIEDAAVPTRSRADSLALASERPATRPAILSIAVELPAGRVTTAELALRSA